MRIFWVCALAVAVVLVGALAAAGQCTGPGCGASGGIIGGLFPGRQAGPQPVDTRQCESACRVREKTREGYVACSGILVAKGDDYGVVWTAAHGVTGSVSVEFPDGEEFQAEVLILDRPSDTALIKTIGKPRAAWAKIADRMPSPGEVVYYAGFGDGRWAIFRGQYVRRVMEARTDGTPVLSGVMEWRGGARHGDSGGPVWGEDGRVFGVITGTDGTTSVGPGVDKLYELTQSGRYFLPWNADLAAKQMEAEQAQSLTPSQCCPGGQCPPELLDGVRRIEQKVDTIGQAVGAVAKPEDVKEAVEEVKPVIGEEVAEAVAGAGLTTTIKTAISKTMGWFGLGGGLLMTAGIGVGAWFLARVLRKNALAIAAVVDKITDRIPGEVDDRLVDEAAYRLAEIVSGQKRPAVKKKVASK